MVWPSLSRFVSRYSRLWSFGSTSIGSWETAVIPKPLIPEIFLGLFVRTRIVDSPRSARICDPMPYSRDRP